MNPWASAQGFPYSGLVCNLLKKSQKMCCKAVSHVVY